MGIIDNYLKSKEVNAKRILVVYADGTEYKFVVDKYKQDIRILNAYNKDAIFINSSNLIKKRYDFFINRAIKKYYNFRTIETYRWED